MARTRVSRSGVSQRRRSSTVSGAGPRPATGGTIQPPKGKTRTASATVLENCPPRNICRAHASAEYFCLRNRHDITVEDYKVRIFAGRERSGDLFLKPGKCGPDRHRLERLLSCHPLLRKPSSRRPVVVVLA